MFADLEKGRGMIDFILGYIFGMITVIVTVVLAREE